MCDELPEQNPGLTTILMCMPKKKVQLHAANLHGKEDLCFGEACDNLVPESFLKTQRKAFEDARLRPMTKKRTKTTRRTLTAEVKRKEMRRRLKTRTEAPPHNLGFLRNG